MLAPVQHTRRRPLSSRQNRGNLGEHQGSQTVKLSTLCHEPSDVCGVCHGDCTLLDRYTMIQTLFDNAARGLWEL